MVAPPGLEMIFQLRLSYLPARMEKSPLSYSCAQPTSGSVTDVPKPPFLPSQDSAHLLGVGRPILGRVEGVFPPLQDALFNQLLQPGPGRCGWGSR